MQKGNSVTKRIRLFVTKKWLCNKTFHRISCFDWRKGMGMSTGVQIMDLWCGAWRTEKLVQTVAAKYYICYQYIVKRNIFTYHVTDWHALTECRVVGCHLKVSMFFCHFILHKHMLPTLSKCSGSFKVFHFFSLAAAAATFVYDNRRRWNIAIWQNLFTNQLLCLLSFLMNICWFLHR